ncbi:MAG: radical SAM family heme chaperone HemW [Planctomycetes bacterium]|nr:radical SAM family heme chaperone HemW [Planctomycetota bacterium]
MTTPEPIRAVYVHVPFCRRLCGYCDFYSIVPEEGMVGPLVDALLGELDHYSGRPDLAVGTVFVGGGTPTTLPAGELRRLLDRLRQLAPSGTALEFTVEANPETVTPQMAQVLVAAGANRVSIGAQSFDPAELAVLERGHRPEDVAKTVALCREAGLRQVNLDLIFAIPGQTLDSWLASLRAATALQPEHLSCYSLTFEPGTRLFEQLQAGAVTAVDQDLDATMYEAAIDALTAAGYVHYEISNFARPGYRCRHNLAYWHNQPYLGIGPAAAGLVDGVRYKNVADVATYTGAVAAGRSPRAEEERRSAEQRARETAMLELRLTEGIDRRRFEQRYGHDPVEFFAEAVRRHSGRGLLEVTDRHLRLTRPGLSLADTVIADFL